MANLVRIFDFKCDKCHTYADFFNIENILWHNIIKKMINLHYGEV